MLLLPTRETRQVWPIYLGIYMNSGFECGFFLFTGDISRQSGRVTFPQSAKSLSSSKSAVAIIQTQQGGNPFKVPPDQDIFMLRDKERLRKKEVGYN